MKLPDKIKIILTDLIFYLSILFFIVGFNFSDNPPPSGWYQQWMPNLGGKTIQDMEFLDSLIGYATARQTGDTSYVLKTTNGGDNWQIIYRNFYAMTNIQFLNTEIGYCSGAYLYKTTDGGFNWVQINAPPISPQELFALNQDTIWLVQSESLVGGVYRTTNGGASWTRVNLSPNNPDRIYMYNARIGFTSGGGQLRKTTDGGISWILIANNEFFNDMYFADSLLGWKAGPMKKTTDGGLNWVNQIMPIGGYISTSGILRFSNINNDTIWGCSGTFFYPGQGQRAFLHRTTNGGNNWLIQVPDTSYQLPILYYVDFVNKLNGWSYFINRGIHTVTGGNDTFYTSAKKISTGIPKDFILYQNYPNPFNPATNIKYEVKTTTYIKLIIYDITGRLIDIAVNDKHIAGIYEVQFSSKKNNSTELSSGVYFYSLYADNKLIDTKTMILVK